MMALFCVVFFVCLRPFTWESFAIRLAVDQNSRYACQTFEKPDHKKSPPKNKQQIYSHSDCPSQLPTSTELLKHRERENKAESSVNREGCCSNRHLKMKQKQATTPADKSGTKSTLKASAKEWTPQASHSSMLPTKDPNTMVQSYESKHSQIVGKDAAVQKELAAFSNATDRGIEPTRTTPQKLKMVQSSPSSTSTPAPKLLEKTKVSTKKIPTDIKKKGRSTPIKQPVVAHAPNGGSHSNSKKKPSKGKDASAPMISTALTTNDQLLKNKYHIK